MKRVVDYLWTILGGAWRRNTRQANHTINTSRSPSLHIDAQNSPVQCLRNIVT